MAIILNPPTGLRDMTQFPDEPGSSAAAREQIQGIIDQVVSGTNSELADITKYPACSLYNGGNQSIASGVSTVLAFNSENYDSDTMHDNATNNTRITIKTAGVYLFLADVIFSGAPTTGYRQVDIKLNGTTTIGTSLVNSGNGDIYVLAAANYKMNVDDYVEVYVSQNSGSSTYVMNSSTFSTTKVG